MTIQPDDPKPMASLDRKMDAGNQKMKVCPPLPGRIVALLILALVTPVMADVHHISGERAGKAQYAFERGRIHQRQGRFEVAEENYRDSIVAVEKSGGAYAPVLIDYLSQLGNLYFHMARYDQAIDQFQRAQHIIHRHQGVYSPKQLVVVEAMTRTYLRTQQISKADKQQRLFYQIVARHYPPDDRRLIPAVDKLGKWLISTGQFRDGIDMYEQQLRIGRSLGDYSSQIAALQMLATSEYLGTRCCPTERLKHAIRLVSENPDKDRGDEVRLLMELGDLYTATDRSDDARKLYRHAHTLLPVTDAQGSARQGSPPELLSLVRPQKLVAAIENAMIGPGYRPRVMETYHLPAPQPTVAARNLRPSFQVVGTPLPLCARAVAELADRVKNVEPTVIDMDFTVNGQGKVSDIKVLGSNGSRGLSEYVVEVLRAARFRPQLIAGETTTSRHVRLTEVIDDNQSAAFSSPSVDPLRISARKACGAWQTGAGSRQPVTS